MPSIFSVGAASINGFGVETLTYPLQYNVANFGFNNQPFFAGGRLSVDGSNNVVYGNLIDGSGPFPAYGYNVGITKIGTGGIVSWSSALLGIASTNIDYILTDSAGVNYVFCYLSGIAAIYLIKVSATGSIISTTSYTPSSPFGYIRVTSAKFDSSGNIFVCGRATSITTSTDYAYVAKINSNLTLAWVYSYVYSTISTSNNVVYDFCFDGSGNIYAYTLAQNNSSSAYFSYILKLNSSGTPSTAYIVTASGLGDVYPASILFDNSNNLIVNSSYNYYNYIIKVPTTLTSVTSCICLLDDSLLSTNSAQTVTDGTYFYNVSNGYFGGTLQVVYIYKFDSNLNVLGSGILYVSSQQYSIVANVTYANSNLFINLLTNSGSPLYRSTSSIIAVPVSYLSSTANHSVPGSVGGLSTFVYQYTSSINSSPTPSGSAGAVSNSGMTLTAASSSVTNPSISPTLYTGTFV